VTKYRILILGLFATSLISCSSTNNVAGTYTSNFAVNGFFGTRINLNTDSTFGYRMRGDMMFDTSNGHYKVDNNYIVLYHEPYKPDTSEYVKYGKEAVLLSYALSTNNHLAKPEKYLVRHRKLFICDTYGRIIKKQFGYSKRRQFILFGKHWYKKRYYLKRAY